MSKKYGKACQKNPKMTPKREPETMKHQSTIDAEVGWKIDRNMMVSDSAETRFALYSSLILHMGCFRKIENMCWKISEKKQP